MKRFFNKIRLFFKYINKKNRMIEFGFSSFTQFEKEILISKEFRRFLFDFLGKNI